MRKKLVFLGFALAALAAASTSTTASASSCPPRTYEFHCADFTVCCPFGALCHC